MLSWPSYGARFIAPEWKRSLITSLAAPPALSHARHSPFALGAADPVLECATAIEAFDANDLSNQEIVEPRRDEVERVDISGTDDLRTTPGSLLTG